MKTYDLSNSFRQAGTIGAAILLFGLLPTSASAIQSTPVDSKINQVTVYPDRAGIERVVSIELPAGDHTLVFNNLPYGADQSSFRASADGPAGTRLLGLTHSIVQHLETVEQRTALLTAEIKKLDRETRQVLADRLAVLQERKKLLAAMTEHRGRELADDAAQAQVDIANWAAAYQFFAAQMALVADSTRMVKQQIEDVDRQMGVLQSELNQVRGSQTIATRTVTVDLRLAEAGTVDLQLDYMLRNAGWQPLYDARLIVAKDSVELGCFAEIRQRTGEDWSNVKLILSTAMPSQGIQPGRFHPFYLAAAQQYTRQADELGKMNAPAMMALEADAEGYAMKEKKIEEPAAPLFAGIDQSGIATTFVASRRETVPSDGSAIRTPLAQWTLGGTMNLISRPRFGEGAYRLMTLVNQEDAPLLPGGVSVFAGSDFLGKTVIGKFVAAGDEFKLPFGRDNAIEVTRKIIDRNRGNGGSLFGLTSEKTRIEETVQITLTNKSRKTRTITIEEPVPISQHDKIKVDFEMKPKPAEIDGEGKAMWSITLKPGEEQVVELTYRIEYPTNLTVSGL